MVILWEKKIFPEKTHLIVSRLALLVPYPEDVLQPGQGHLNDPGVHNGQEVAHGRDTALAHQVLDLVRRTCKRGGKSSMLPTPQPLLWTIITQNISFLTSGAGIGDRPGRFLPRLELRLAQDLYEYGEDVAVDDSLDLLPVSGRDVGDGPAGLLADALLVGVQQVEQAREDRAVQNHLGEKEVTSNHELLSSRKT